MEIGIAKMLKQNTLCLKREGPFLLICLGSIGAIGTAILEAKETVKALLLIIQSLRQRPRKTKLSMILKKLMKSNFSDAE